MKYGNCVGYGLAGNYSTNDGNMTVFEVSNAVKTDETPVDNLTSVLNAIEIESLCLRMHNNTAFMGIQPFTRLMLYSASECRRNCVDLYPKCVAVMFYYLHEREKNHICYLFSKNSIDEDVALVPEKPMKKLDMIRSLEIVADCHQFDPFPPLFTDFTTSTDGVSKKKRDVGYDRPIETTGPWSAWSECSTRSGRQVRSQLCEYGRNIQRRRCSSSASHHALGYGVKITSYAPSIDISISYPPYPYQHPDVSSDEYKRIMSAHSKQMAQSCCYWQDYFRQKTNLANGHKMQIQQQLGVRDGCPTTCSTSTQSKLQPLPYSQPQPQAPVYGPQPQLPVYGPQPQPSVYGLQPQAPVYGPQPQAPVYGPQPQAPVYGSQPQVPVYGPQPQLPADVQAPISVWSSWSEWSFCSATCGIGMIQRYRICNTGQCKGENVEWRTCHQTVPCVASWADWTSWSSCSATCGMGEKTRSRYCYLGANYCTGSDHEVTPCETAPCPGWGQWESWSYCSVTCGTGIKRRTRICNGDKCIGDTYQETHCYQEQCEGWSEWQEWSACSVSCGEGVIIRERVCMGRNCIGESSEQNICVEEACSTWQEWGEWSTCSAKCNFGISTRRRLCHGIFCPGKRMEVMPCHAGRCAMWSTWQEWSECSVTCDSGIQQRYRNCIGDNCMGSTEDIKYCETGISCPQWTKWTAWSRCSHDCGIGERVRYRECSSAGEPTDSCEGQKSETAVCLERLCCEWTAWTSWTPCSHMCGTGRSSRTKMCLRLGYEQDDSSCTGQCYGNSREDKTCSEQISCATPTYPPVCVRVTGYTPGLPSTAVAPSTDGSCPPGYVLAPGLSGYIPTSITPGYTPTSITPGYIPASITSGYTPGISASGYVSAPDTPDYTVVPTAAGYVPSPSVPGYFPPPSTSGYPAAPGVSGYVFVPGTPDYVVASYAPGYVTLPSAPGYVLPRSAPGYFLTPSGYAMPAGIFIEVRCHWAEWYQWSACEKTCYHHVKRRTRHCIGEDECMCSGDAQEEINCLLPPECKI
ncbi:Thrombospondin type 1 domain family protein [Brugia pahangi]